MDHEEIHEYLTHRHELSDIEFEKEVDDRVFFTAVDKDTQFIGVILEAEHDKVNIYYVQDGQSWIEEVVTVTSYEEFLQERLGA